MNRSSFWKLIESTRPKRLNSERREIAPGRNGVVKIAFPRPIGAGERQRFLLLHKNHVAAAGFFMDNEANNP